MNGIQRTFMRRGSALVTAVTLVVGSAACASHKTPAQTDSQATARGSVDRGPGGGGPRGGRGDARLFVGITLSDAQRTQIDSIRASYRERMQAARNNGGGDRSQFRQMMEEQRTAIRAVLTSDQQQVFDRNVEQMRNERGRGGPGGGAPGGSGPGGR